MIDDTGTRDGNGVRARRAACIAECMFDSAHSELPGHAKPVKNSAMDERADGTARAPLPGDRTLAP